NTVANAAREGARYGVVLDRTALLTSGNAAGSYTGTNCDMSANPDTIVCHTVAMTPGLEPAKLQIAIATPGVLWLNEPLQVTVGYPFQTQVPGITGSATFTLTAAATMRLEYPQ